MDDDIESRRDNEPVNLGREYRTDLVQLAYSYGQFTIKRFIASLARSYDDSVDAMYQFLQIRANA